MGDPKAELQTRHSFCSTESVKHLDKACCKSEVAVVGCKGHENIDHLKTFCQYYKKYEHDEEPVKDSSSSATSGAKKQSLTNSDLDRLEKKIFSSMSEEFQTESMSVASLESNIKFFKSTVQEIFDNFYNHMDNFEHYKKRFNEILAKSQENAVAEMEEFIKDMIHHIMSCESILSNPSKKSYESKLSSTISTTTGEFSSSGVAECEICETPNFDPCYVETPDTISKQTLHNTDTNEGYMLKSVDKTITTTKLPINNEDVVNVYLLDSNPCVHIKMRQRNLLSEMNIKATCNKIGDGKYIASAENIRKRADKKLELEKYVHQKQNIDDGPDIEIPVKTSNARKNIRCDEDVTPHERKAEKTFLTKLCNYLYRKFTKS